MQSENNKKLIAYFSMEIGIDPSVQTYSGGLGILAGDTVKSFADLKIPAIAVSLLYKKGYIFQKIDEKGNQLDLPYEWEYENFLKPLKASVSIKLRGRDVQLKAWQYLYKGASGFEVPVIFLDTDIVENHEDDRKITYYLYGGDEAYRLLQEAVLGIGGVRMLSELGYDSLKKYHMNEGHSSLLSIELLRNRKIENINQPETLSDAIARVRNMCVFTTHTPVPAGHDQFSYSLVEHILGDYISLDILKRFAGNDKLNMTLTALNLSRYINGVAKAHGKVSRDMFPGYTVDSITNGVHSFTWVSGSLKKLFDEYIPEWFNDPYSLRYAISIPKDKIWKAHVKEKAKLIKFINSQDGNKFSEKVFTIGFARRATAYKRPDLVFMDIDRLARICSLHGSMQFVFSGKAHPNDYYGKELIKKINNLSVQLREKINIVFVENYDMEIAGQMVAGVDLWLNTPKRPNEASGTSGMKAAHNGVPSLSILDGWWIEGCIEGITGWAIGSVADDSHSSDEKDAASLYDKLENNILKMFYHQHGQWVDIMRYSIAINASFFNTHRMVQQYVTNAYVY